VRRPGRHPGALAPSCFTVSGYAGSTAVRKPRAPRARLWNYFTSPGHCRGKTAPAKLRAIGEATRIRDLSALDQLTPQEQPFAGLVADGLINADIAAPFFLSPRTIYHHLHKVFLKLGIASRTELAPPGLPPARDGLNSRTSDLADANGTRLM
jgi:DNA-binding CsgD family transcriptional regulator